MNTLVGVSTLLYNDKIFREDIYPKYLKAVEYSDTVKSDIDEIKQQILYYSDAIVIDGKFFGCVDYYISKHDYVGAEILVLNVFCISKENKRENLLVLLRTLEHWWGLRANCYFCNNSIKKLIKGE